MKKATAVFLAFGLMFALVGCTPDLVVRNLEVNWNDANKSAKADIVNIGDRDAGRFLVYFNADENPVSPNRRPQVTHDVPGLGKGESITLESDFAPLAHSDNNYLGNVFKITVIADPKNSVKESNEDNNEEEAPIPTSPGCAPANSDITTGSTGILHPGQSFNETRAVDVTVLGSTNRIVENLALKGLNPGTLSATVGARIYDSTTQALIASANITVSGGGSNLTLTVPLSATLVSGQNYRIGFYVETNPLWQASGNLFVPFSSLQNQVPYTEDTGVFRINSAHAIGSDGYPANPNLATPQMTIQTRCP